MMTALRPLLADARRNRDRLLAIARERSSTTVSTPRSTTSPAPPVWGSARSIVTSHPANALIEALIGDDITHLSDLAAELVLADAADGVERWLEALITHGVTFRGLADTLTARHTDGTTLGVLRHRMHAAGAAVVRHAQAWGRIRLDVDPVDPVDLATSIAWITEADADDERRRRLLRIAVDGLRAPR